MASGHWRRSHPAVGSRHYGVDGRQAGHRPVWPPSTHGGAHGHAGIPVPWRYRRDRLGQVRARTHGRWRIPLVSGSSGRLVRLSHIYRRRHELERYAVFHQFRDRGAGSEQGGQRRPLDLARRHAATRRRHRPGVVDGNPQSLGDECRDAVHRRRPQLGDRHPGRRGIASAASAAAPAAIGTAQETPSALDGGRHSADARKDDAHRSRRDFGFCRDPDIVRPGRAHPLRRWRFCFPHPDREQECRHRQPALGRRRDGRSRSCSQHRARGLA